MARKIIWSENAKNEKIEILRFQIKRNQSNAYSKKLNILFKEAIKLIVNNPGAGHITIKENVRVKIVKDYLIIYKITPDTIQVLSIFDGRRNPEDFKKIF